MFKEGRLQFCSDECRYAFVGENMSGENNQNFGGKSMTDDTRYKMRLAHLGEKNYNWKGGAARYSHFFKQVLGPMMKALRRYRCECCGKHQVELAKMGITLDAHHRDGNKHNDTPENTEILCHTCHMAKEYMLGMFDRRVYKKPRGRAAWRLKYPKGETSEDENSV